MNDFVFVNRLMQSEELLSTTEKKIADFIKNHKTDIDKMGISDISEKTESSNASVSRLINKLGYSSFGEFKAMISREDITDTINNESTVTDIIANYYSQLTKSASELLDLKDVSAVVKGIKKARQVLICGIGNSGLTALEFKYRLTRMGITADALTDPHMMLMRTSLLHEDDVLIVLSNSGKTPAILKTSELANSLNISVYAITNHNYTPLIQYADVVLFTSQKSIIQNEKFVNSQFATHFIMDIMTYVLLNDAEYLEKRIKTLRLLD
ncbi:RpiR family transcriptional regulator [Alkalibacterium kapii]|uniref:RpiR family transcriptional regulator n=2 Tax=Alkalibacterium kapii TaxID=426704 RepID=A0A511ASF5_9LACT|nr:RpiR family transcriptional regulator [Alkalibacterium kapii]